jgi:hypothetical protein
MSCIMLRFPRTAVPLQGQRPKGSVEHAWAEREKQRHQIRMTRSSNSLESGVTLVPNQKEQEWLNHLRFHCQKQFRRYGQALFDDNQKSASCREKKSLANIQRHPSWRNETKNSNHSFVFEDGVNLSEQECRILEDRAQFRNSRMGKTLKHQQTW